MPVIAICVYVGKVGVITNFWKQVTLAPRGTEQITQADKELFP